MSEPIVRIGGDATDDVEMGDNAAEMEEAMEALEGADVGEGDAEGDEDEGELFVAPRLTYIECASFLLPPVLPTDMSQATCALP